MNLNNKETEDIIHIRRLKPYFFRGYKNKKTKVKYIYNIFTNRVNTNIYYYLQRTTRTRNFKSCILL